MEDIHALVFSESVEGADKWHALIIPDTTGDTKIMWTQGNADEVATAKRSFDDLRAKGFMIYKAAKDGNRGELMREFDPAAELLIAVPPIVGVLLCRTMESVTQPSPMTVPR